MKENGSGWIVFAAIIMILGGIANFLWGIAAVAKETLLISNLLFANLTFWGVLAMILGPVLALAGVAVLYRMEWAITFAIIWASISIVFWLFVIWVFPAMSILVIALDALVLYGLVTYEGGAEISAD